MRAKIEYGIRQALEARQKADSCLDNHVREQWLAVAKMWDDLVRAYEEVAEARERMLAMELTRSPSSDTDSSH